MSVKPEVNSVSMFAAATTYFSDDVPYTLIVTSVAESTAVSEL
jgi:hypothetical protein